MLKQNLAVSILFVLLVVAAGTVAHGQVPGVTQEPASGSNPGPTAEGEAYYGTAEGHGGELTVEVRLDDDRIVAVVVTEHQETESLAEPAFQQLTETIIQQQSTDVDVVSGATETSEALLLAVQRAVDEAE